MEVRQCGTDGLELPVLGLGCWQLGGGEYWGYHERETEDRVIRTALDLGVNYFDTAEAYNDGRSEQALGRALKNVPRDQFIVGTKLSPANAFPDRLKRHCEDSLRRLGMEYIDIYFLHWPLTPSALRYTISDEQKIQHPPDTGEVFQLLEALRQEGKIRHIAVSNFGIRNLQDLEQLPVPVTVNQVAYNMFSRAIEYDVLPYGHEHTIGIMAYMVLLQGLLAGKYDSLEDVPPPYRRTRHFNMDTSELARHGEAGAEEEMETALRQLRELCDETGIRMADLAVKWTIADPGVTCALVGSVNEKHLTANVRAVATPLDPSLVQRINTITQPVLEKLGTSIDLWEGPEHDRTR